MNIKKSNEELIEALAEAAGAAFASLKENTKEHFYFYVFVFDILFLFLQNKSLYQKAKNSLSQPEQSQRYPHL